MLVARVVVLAAVTVILLVLLLGNAARRTSKPGWPTLLGLALAVAMTAWSTFSAALLL